MFSFRTKVLKADNHNFLYPLLQKKVKGYIVFVGMYVTGRRRHLRQ